MAIRDYTDVHASTWLLLKHTDAQAIRDCTDVHRDYTDVRASTWLLLKHTDAQAIRDYTDVHASTWPLLKHTDAQASKKRLASFKPQGTHHIPKSLRYTCRVGPNTIQYNPYKHTHIRCIYGISSRDITLQTVICGVHIRFWPTLYTCPVQRTVCSKPGGKRLADFKTHRMRDMLSGELKWRTSCIKCAEIARICVPGTAYGVQQAGW